MFLKEFYTESASNVNVLPEQASHFAKEVAGDFNPLHDIDAKRFCVPGDLLFALVLHKQGLSQDMLFSFSGMVGRGVNLQFPVVDDNHFAICDDSGKQYLDVVRKGKTTHCQTQIAALIKEYVAFSGRNFPFIMMPLLEKHNVMLNPERPLVVYESMGFQLENVDFEKPELSLANAELNVSGKRGDVVLSFEISCGGKVIGTGNKKLVLSGLREYDADVANAMSNKYVMLRDNYQG